MQITTNATIRNTWVIISKILLLLKEMARQAQTDNGNYLLHRFLLQHFCSTPTTQKKKKSLYSVTLPVASGHRILLLVLKIPLPLQQHTNRYHLEHFELARTQAHPLLVISFD